MLSAQQVARHGALAEPLAPGTFEEFLPDHDAVADELEKAYRRIRRKALNRGLVRTKHVGGAVPDNTKGEVDGVRRRIAVKGNIPVGKDLSPDFYLAIKQPGMFTALLPTMAEPFPLLRHRERPTGDRRVLGEHPVGQARA